MKKAAFMRALRVGGLLAVAFAVTSADAIAQRPLPPDPRNPFRRAPTVGEQRYQRWFVTVHGGLANPVGDLGNVSSSGAALGFEVGQWVRDWSTLRFRSDIEFPGGALITTGPNAGQDIPGWLMWSIDIGGTLDVTRGQGPFLFGVDMGFGATLLESGDLRNQSISQWYLSLTPGLVLGHRLGSVATFIVDGRYRFLFTDKNQLESFLPDAASSLSHIQVQAGLQFLVTR